MDNLKQCPLCPKVAIKTMIVWHLKAQHKLSGKVLKNEILKIQAASSTKTTKLERSRKVVRYTAQAIGGKHWQEWG